MSFINNQSKLGYNTAGRSLAVSQSNKIPFIAGIICIVLVAISLRPAIVSNGPLLPSIKLDFGLSHTMASMLITIPDLAMGALAFPTPWLARRYGRNRVVLLALVTLLIAIVSRTFSETVEALLLTTLGVGAGIAIAGTLIASFIKANFPQKTAFMMSIYAAALGLGSTLASAVSGPLADYLGSWRASSLSWAILCLVAILGWLYIERGEARLTPVQNNINKPQRSLPLKSHKAWLIALFFAFNNLLFYALLSWLVPMFVEKGLSTNATALLLTIFTSCCMIASLIFGLISRQEDRRLLLALSAILVLTGIILMTVGGSAIGPYLPVSLMALGIGGGFSLGMTLPLDNASDEDEAGNWTAFVLTIGYLIAAIGPIAVGFLRDLSGDYTISLWLLVIIAVATLILVPFLAPRQLQKCVNK